MNTIDYSRKDNWFKIPEITKDIDTFFIYPTEYLYYNNIKENVAKRIAAYQSSAK